MATDLDMLAPELEEKTMEVVMLAPAPNTYNYLSRQGNDVGWKDAGSGICTQEYNSLHCYFNVVSPIPH